MGLAASQSRLLSLTSRLSDLELRSQTISNSKLHLAQASSEASAKYNAALTKEKLTVKTGYNSDGDGIYQEATAANLMAFNPEMTQRILKNSYGQVIADESTVAKFQASSNVNEFINKMGYSAYDNSATAISAMTTSLSGKLSNEVNSITGKDSSGQEYIYATGKTKALNDAVAQKAQALKDVDSITSLSQVGSSNPVIDNLSNISTLLTGAFTGDAASAISGATGAISAASVYASGSGIEINPNNYSDSDIMRWLNANASDIKGGSYTTSIDDLDTAEFLADYEWADSTSGIRYNESTKTYDNSKISSSLNSYVADTCSDVAAALKATTGSSFDQVAADAAAKATAAFYADRLKKQGSQDVNVSTTDNTVSHDGWNKGGEGGNNVNTALNNGSDDNLNLVICAGNNQDCWWVDTNQLIKTYLNFYDAYKKISGVYPSGEALYADNNYKKSAAYTTMNFETETGGGDLAELKRNVESGKLPSMLKTFTDKIDPNQGLNGLTSSERPCSSSAITLDSYKATLKSKINAINVEDLKTTYSNPSDYKTNLKDEDITNTLSNIKQIVDTIRATYATCAELNDVNVDTLLTYAADGYNGEELVNIKNELSKIDFAALLANLQSSALIQDSSLKYDPKAVNFYTTLYNQMVKNGYDQKDSATLNNADWLYSQLKVGGLYLEEDPDGDNAYERISYSSGSSSLIVDDDEKNIAKAKAEYDSIMDQIELKDKKFDLQLKSIDTEHNAVQTEVDSVKKVMEKNIERSLKIFQA